MTRIFPLRKRKISVFASWNFILATNSLWISDLANIEESLLFYEIKLIQHKKLWELLTSKSSNIRHQHIPQLGLSLLTARIDMTYMNIKNVLCIHVERFWRLPCVILIGRRVSSKSCYKFILVWFKTHFNYFLGTT